MFQHSSLWLYWGEEASGNDTDSLRKGDHVEDGPEKGKARGRETSLVSILGKQ